MIHPKPGTWAHVRWMKWQQFKQRNYEAHRRARRRLLGIPEFAGRGKHLPLTERLPTD